MVGQRDSQVTVHWDDSGVKSAYANVFDIAGSREEIALLFGQSRPSDKDGKPVPLTNRILLNPLTAKRLLAQLTRIIREYETTYGRLTKDSPLQRPMPKARLPNFKSSPTHEKVDLLFRLLNDLHLRVAFERSFKVSERNLNGSRFLVGANKHTIARSRHKSIVDACARLGMPDNLLETFRENFAEANVFGFGVDENQETCVVKAYLEFGFRYEEAMKKPPHERDPYISQLGFKWDAADNARCALTKYRCFPALGPQDMLERLSTGFYGAKDSKPYGIIEQAMELASSRAGGGKFLYLELNEGNNPRSSFDLNLYAANLRMQEVYPFLAQMCRHYSIPDESFHALCEPVRDMIFGHLAGGIDRMGKDFLTVYFGT